MMLPRTPNFNVENICARLEKTRSSAMESSSQVRHTNRNLEIWGAGATKQEATQQRNKLKNTQFIKNRFYWQTRFHQQ